MPETYRYRHYLDGVSNQLLLRQWGSSSRANSPQSWLGPQFLGKWRATGRRRLPSLTPRDGGGYDPLLGTTR
jgi:hypothetical protein